MIPEEKLHTCPEHRAPKSSWWKFAAVIAAALIIAGIVVFFQSSGGAAFLWKISDGGKLLLPLVVISSLIDSINPCAFSVLILTIAFLFSIGALRRKIFTVGGSYILGIFTVYILIGLGILQTLHLFNTPNFMAKFGAILLIVLGAINLLGEFFPTFPIKLRIPHAAHRTMARLMEKGSVPTAFILGVVVGLCEFPCTGGPYLMVLGLLHDAATYIKGLGYLLLYNIVFVLPLVVILGIASNRALLDKVQAWQQKERRLMRLGGGLAMIILGAVIFLL